jgi:hypothetical protein
MTPAHGGEIRRRAVLEWVASRLGVSWQHVQVFAVSHSKVYVFISGIGWGSAPHPRAKQT